LPDCPPDLCGSENRSRLLRKIRDSYRKALERLNLRARPGMAPFSLVGADSLPRNVPDTHTSALKGTLQDMIHGFYLEAIVRKNSRWMSSAHTFSNGWRTAPCTASSPSSPHVAIISISTKLLAACSSQMATYS
jgi:hypothetical protein